LSGGGKQLDRAGQSLWGSIGGLTPYAVAALKAVGHRTDFALPSFSVAFCLVLLLSAVFGVLGSILLESHTPFAAWFHGGSFPIMLNFLFGDAVHQAGSSTLH
jgi:hypothetical protein